MVNFEKTFDNAALDYDKSRPMYVKEIYKDIFDYKQINQDSHVLEIGMGTGKAAQPILDTHCHFVGIEPGEDLAALAKERFKKYENFSVYSQTLQDYICADNSFDLGNTAQKGGARRDRRKWKDSRRMRFRYLLEATQIRPTSRACPPGRGLPEQTSYSAFRSAFVNLGIAFF